MLQAMKKILTLISIISVSLSLFALDVVTLRDGTSITGEVSAYTTLGTITIRDENGSLASFSSREVLSIEKSGLGDRAQAYIHFHPEVSKFYDYTPPRYTYRGVSYNVDTAWGMSTDTREFFAYLSEEHPDLDEGTLALIRELGSKQKSQDIRMAVAGLLIGSGTIMTFLPLNLDDIQATPPWAIGVSLTGVSLNVVGVGVLISNLFVRHKEYPRLIAESFNAHIASKDTPFQ
jgi:hypothetical protein